MRRWHVGACWRINACLAHASRISEIFHVIRMGIWNGVVVIIWACSIRGVMRASPGHIWRAAEQSGWEKMKKIPYSECMDQIDTSFYAMRTGSDTSEVSAERGQA